MKRRFRSCLCLIASAALVLELSACATNAAHQEDETAWPDIPAAPPTNGSIYQAGYDVALFENATARRVGDIVTVRLVESTNASKSSTTTTKKQTSLALPGPTIAGRPVTVNGTPILDTALEHKSSFDGAGDSKQSNQLSGDITVAVIKAMPNGLLLIRGQKRIGINQGSEFIRVQGVIRQIDIGPDNSIESSKVGNASISYGGKGALADANAQSWLSRFFNSPWLPF
jgi:flagellar L-ring protein precursor FlgH